MSNMQLPAGFDPSQVDPQWLKQMTNALRRLPRFQQQKVQQIMQQAMQGKDISAEVAVIEKMLPPDIRALVTSFNFAMKMAAMQGAQDTAMDPNQARKIIEDAVKAGKLSQEEAEKLLAIPMPETPAQAMADGSSTAETGETAKPAGLWKKIFGKKKNQ